MLELAADTQKFTQNVIPFPQVFTFFSSTATEGTEKFEIMII